MKTKIKWTIFLSLFLLAVSCRMLDLQIQSDDDAEADPIPTGDIPAMPDEAGWLYTSGNKIFISDGDPSTPDEIFVGRGANVYDSRNNGRWMNPQSVAKRDEYFEKTKDIYDELIDEWGANFVRLCLDSRKEVDVSANNWTFASSFIYDDIYMNQIEELVQYLDDKGVYVMITSWTEPTITKVEPQNPVDGVTYYPAEGVPSPDTMPRLYLLANRLAKYKNVIFAACNEPEGAGNGNADEENFIFQQMSTAVEVIRQAEADAGAPQHVIAIQGTRSYARKVTYYLDHPITAAGGTNIAYEIHAYYHNEVVNNVARDEKFPAGTLKYDAYIVEPSRKYPIIVGEYGLGNTNSAEDLADLFEIFDTYHISSTGWIFSDSGAPTLLYDLNSYTPTPWGEILKEWLVGHSNKSIYFGEPVITPFRSSTDKMNHISIEVPYREVKGTLISAAADFSELGGGIVNGTISQIGIIAAFDLAAGYPVGTYQVPLTVQISGSSPEIINVDIIVTDAEDRQLYTSDRGLQSANLKQVQGVSIEFDDQVFYEGNESIKMSYNFNSGGYAKWRISLNDNFDVNDYQYLQMAVRFNASTSGAYAAISLWDNDQSGKESNKSYIDDPESNSPFEVINIPISAFSGGRIDLKGVDSIVIGVSHRNKQAASGTFWIDDVRLISY